MKTGNVISSALAALFAAALPCASALAEIRETAFVFAAPKSGEIVVDGAISEKCWQEAPPCTEYFEGRSLLGLVDVKTSCRVLYDNAGIYVGVEHRGLDTAGLSPADIVRNTSANRSTSIHSDDTCELYFDPACAGISYFRWMINANGRHLDTYCMDVSNIMIDWDAPSGVEVASKILEDGWSAEYFAPWHVFNGRSAARPGDVWGFAHLRKDSAFRKTRGKALKCGNAPKAGWLSPDQFAFLYFLRSRHPLRADKMANAVSERFAGEWVVKSGDKFMVKDEMGFHPVDLMEDVRRKEREKAAAKAAFDVLFAGGDAKPLPMPLAGKYPLGRPEKYNGFDGSWRYNVDPDAVKTPCLKWAQDRAERPRILFMTDFGLDGCLRDMIEYAARFACEPMFLPGLIGDENTYSKRITLSSGVDRASHLETLLARDPEIIVVDGFKTSTLSTNYLYEIFRRVRDCGTGLLVLGEGGPRNARPLADLAQKMEPLGDGLYRFGRGRVKLMESPIGEWSLEWKAAYESRFAAIDDAVECVWKGARQPRPSISAGESSVTVAAVGVDCDAVEVRVRDAWNATVRTEMLSAKGGACNFSLSMDGLPGGDYWVDAIARKDARAVSAATASVRRDGVIGRVRIGADDAGDVVVEEGAPASVQVAWERRAGGAVRVVCELSDRPYGNVRRRMERVVAEGVTGFVCRLGAEPFQTLSGDLDVKVYDGEAVLGHGRRVVYFPSRRHEMYPMVSWGGADSAKLPELFAPQLVELMGYRNGLAWSRGRNDSAFNARSVPYTTRVMLYNRNGRGCEWERAAPFGSVKKLKGDASPYNPVAREVIGKAFGKTVAKAAPYRPLAWSFGDECEFGYDLGIGAASDKTAFPAFLKAKYGDVAAYNRAHGTSIADFSQALHKTVAKSLEDGDLVSWLDNVQHSEQTYADMFRFLAELVHERDPGALAGAEGSPAGDMERVVEACSFWGPYRNLVENELLRNVAPNHLRTIWLGGYVGTSARDGYPEHQWEFLLTGVVNGDAWFSTRPGGVESCFSGDFSMAPYAKRYMPYLDGMRRGVAPLLVKTPIREEAFAVYYSHASRHLASVCDGLQSPMKGLEKYILFTYRTGLDCRMVTPRTLGRLDGIRVLFLCNAYALSDGEVAAFRAFAARGGVIAANVEPGQWDGFLARRSAPPLAGLWRTFDFADFGRAKKEADVRGFLAANGIDRAERVEGLPGNPYVSHADPKNPPATSTDLTQLHPKVIRVRELEYAPGKTMRIVGFKTYPRFVGSDVKVLFGEVGHVYEVDRGFVAKGDSVAAKLDVPFKLYSFFPEVQTPPPFTLDRAAVEPGESVRLDVSRLRMGGVYRLEVRSPEGRSLPGRECVFCRDASQGEMPVQFPFSDPPGEYGVVVRDIATGLEASRTVSLRSAR